MSAPPRPPWIRLGFMLAVVAFMFGGPFSRQVLHQPNAYLRRWVMFNGYGHKICEVRWFDAQGQRLDRCALLGFEDCRDMPTEVQALRNAQDVRAQRQEICALESTPPGVLTQGRCGSKRYWNEVIAPRTPACP